MFFLLNKIKDVTLLFVYILLSFFILLFGNAYALTNMSDVPFEKIVEQVETLKDDNANKALNLLNSFNIKLEDLAVDQRITYFKLLAEIYVEQDQYLLSKATATKGLTLAKQLVSPTIVIAELLYVKAFATENLGDLAAAELDYENGLDIARSLHDKVAIANGLINLGAIYYLTRRYDRSLVVFNDAYTIANRTDDEELKGFINSELGILYGYLGQSDKSLQFYEQSYAHFKNAGKVFYAYNSLGNIAHHHNNNKRYGQAIDVYQEIINGADKSISRYMMYSVYSGMAWAQLKKQDSNPEAAYQYILLAGQYSVNTQQYDVPLQYLIHKAEILENLQRYEEALDTLFEAEVLFDQQKTPQQRWHYSYLLTLKSKAYSGLGRFKDAYKLISEVVDLAVELHDKENVLVVEDLRLRYESYQADLLTKILQQKRTVKTLELAEASQANNQQRIYLFISSILVLVFAWLLIKLIYDQRFLLQASRTDNLTGVLNRRRLMQVGESIFKQTKHKQLPLSLIMININHFQRIHDSFGHKLSDKVLQNVSLLIKDMLRKTDVIGRFSSDEFVIYLPNTDNDQGQKIAERLQLMTTQQPWDLSQIETIAINLSVVEYSADTHPTLEAFIKSASELLAKNTIVAPSTSECLDNEN